MTTLSTRVASLLGALSLLHHPLQRAFFLFSIISLAFPNLPSPPSPSHLTRARRSMFSKGHVTYLLPVQFSVLYLVAFCWFNHGVTQAWSNLETSTLEVYQIRPQPPGTSMENSRSYAVIAGEISVGAARSEATTSVVEMRRATATSSAHR